jgi:exonuclease III
VAIWIKKNVEFKLIDEYKDNEGRLLPINVEINNAIYTIINIYAPNNMNKRNTFFKQVDKGVGMIRVDFGSISETVYIDIILNTIIER